MSSVFSLRLCFRLILTYAVLLILRVFPVFACFVLLCLIPSCDTKLSQNCLKKYYEILIDLMMLCNILCNDIIIDR